MTMYKKTMREALEEVASFEIKEEVELDENVIDKVKKIASEKQAMKIDGVLVDMFTASAISQIYDKVNDANKKKMEKLPIIKLANLAFKMMQKNEFVPEEVELDEAPKYDLYHKDFSSAMQHAYKMAKKLHGITIDPKEIDDKVASGPKKPSSGKTNSYRLKGDKGAIQVQVYNMDNKKYELNMYKEEVEVEEGKMSQLHQYIKDKKSAEEIAKIMKLDVKTIKALMNSYNPEEVELDLEKEKN